jgi:hypothetical protein
VLVIIVSGNCPSGNPGCGHDALQGTDRRSSHPIATRLYHRSIGRCIWPRILLQRHEVGVVDADLGRHELVKERAEQATDLASAFSPQLSAFSPAVTPSPRQTSCCATIPPLGREHALLQHHGPRTMDDGPPPLPKHERARPRARARARVSCGSCFLALLAPSPNDLRRPPCLDHPPIHKHNPRSSPSPHRLIPSPPHPPIAHHSPPTTSPLRKHSRRAPNAPTPPYETVFPDNHICATRKRRSRRSLSAANRSTPPRPKPAVNKQTIPRGE